MYFNYKAKNGKLKIKYKEGGKITIPYTIKGKTLIMKDSSSIINTGLLDYIPADEHDKALGAIQVSSRSFAKGETIISSGDQIDSICVIAEGIVRSEKTYTDGVTHLVAMFEPHTLFALEFAMSKTRVTPVDFIAHEKSRILFIRYASIKESDYWEPMRRALVEKLADEVVRKSNKIQILAEHNIRDRVLVYLNILVQKTGRDEVILSMNREQLAQFLCVNRSSLSNELSQMQEEGIIEFRKNRFRLLRTL